MTNYLTELLNKYAKIKPEYVTPWNNDETGITQLENILERLAQGETLQEDTLINDLETRHYAKDLVKIMKTLGYIKKHFSHGKIILTETGKRFLNYPNIDSLLSEIAIDRLEQAESREIERLGGCTKYAKPRMTLTQEMKAFERISKIKFPKPKED